ncbi:broad-minded protein-domain-containing protein [Phlyctochytrium arcticum]|nr:broad-minded protein-domain-containing protein [Phlyctochytrium arcticum]
MSSSEYASLMHTVLEQATAGMDEILEHGTSHYMPNQSRRGQPMFPDRRVSMDFSTHSNTTNESACGSLSLTHSPIIEEIQSAIINLQNNQPVEVRLAAMQTLTSYPSSDLLCVEFWKDAKVALMISLEDSDARVVQAGLRLYSRVYKAAQPPMTGEVYLSLLDHLRRVFEAGHYNKLSDGLAIDDPKVQLLLKKFRLFNQFQKEITSCWIRYPELLMKEVMLKTFQFLCKLTPTSKFSSPISSVIAAGESAYLKPLHYLSIVDSTASWFEKWMMSEYGRAPVISALMQCGLLVEFAAAFAYFSERLLQMNTSLSKVDEVLVIDVEASEDLDELAARKKIGSGDLEYINFLHVLMILSKLAIFKGGRGCFPIKFECNLPVSNMIAEDLNADKAHNSGNVKSWSLSVQGLTRLMVKLMCYCAKAELSTAGEENYKERDAVEHLKLSKFICRLLKEITITDQEFTSRLLQRDILARLIEPLLRRLSAKKSATFEKNDVLLDIAETLTNIVTTESGRRFVLQTEMQLAVERPDLPFEVRKSSNALDAVVEFINISVSHGLSSLPSVRVVSAYIFFLRQLYRTCEGLHILQRYGLHNVLAKTLHDSTRKSCESAQELSMQKEWNAAAVDNLLNFSGTPKGVMLLQLSGSMSVCVSHMFQRYEKKMQVSQCEKFGYGVLVSQISSTKPGMGALYASGLLKSFFLDLWALLESDRMMTLCVPRSEPSDDHAGKKLIGNLLKAFASFPGLSSIVDAEFQSSGGRETFDYLMRVIILRKRPEKSNETIPDLFEEFHQIGLKILKLMTSSLDSFILLQCKYHFQEALLGMQAENIITSGRLSGIIDECSLLRTYILVATYAVGSSTERRLPSLHLPDVLTDPLPVFVSYPIPDQYIYHEKKPNGKVSNICCDLQEAIASRGHTGPLSVNWLADVQSKVLEVVASTTQVVDWRPFIDIMQTFVVAIGGLPANATDKFGWQTISRKPFPQMDGPGEKGDLDQHSAIGIDLVVRYASQHCAAADAGILGADMKKLLQWADRSLTKGSRATKNPDTSFEGFDWFLATLFLGSGASLKKSKAFATSIFQFLPSVFLWSSRARFHQKVTESACDIPIHYSTCCHLVEWITELELPSVFSAFTLSGCTPSQICQRWLREMFWNVLSFPEIVNYLLLCITLGIDYQIYYCIAFLRHLSLEILRATREQDLITFVNERPQAEAPFLVRNHLDFMKDLQRKYRVRILAEMKDTVIPKNET